MKPLRVHPHVVVDHPCDRCGTVMPTERHEFNDGTIVLRLVGHVCRALPHPTFCDDATCLPCVRGKREAG